MPLFLGILIKFFTDAMAWFLIKLGDRSYSVMLGGAIAASAYAAIFAILKLIGTYAIPDAVAYVMMVLAPRDWKQQFATVLAVKAISFTHFHLRFYLDRMV